MNPQILRECGEFFAAGFFADPDAPVIVRMARGVASHLADAPLPLWRGTRLYPGHGNEGQRPVTAENRHDPCLYFHYPTSMTWDPHKLTAQIEQEQGARKKTLTALKTALEEYPFFESGWTHSSPNYRRILAEGLDSHGERIRRGRQRAEVAGQTDKLPFYEAVQIVLDAIRAYRGRAGSMLRGLDGLSQEEQGRRNALAQALERVPFAAARTFHEAMVAVDFLYYVDGGDTLGRFDQDLIPYYRRDLASGEITRDEALELVRELWRNMEYTFGWNVAIGGTAPDGGPGANELTAICMEAARGRRAPNLALRLRHDTPQAIWDTAFDTLATGCGLPALYSEENYMKSIRGVDLGVREEDLPDFAFGGCTELIVHGMSNCGCADGTLNLPLVLDKTIGAELAACATFDEFYGRFERDLLAAIDAEVDRINHQYRQAARWQPQVIRSLLMDDCIDEGVDFNAGGARYNWCVTTIGGLGNVADSLHALREVVFEDQEVTPEEMVGILAADFAGHEDVRGRLMRCARFGNDDARVDELASRVAELTFRTFLSRSTWRGGKFVPACLLLNWYAAWGKQVGASPDGRKAGEPIADSAGAVQGRDTSGPTAMIRSVTRLPHHLAPGTLIVNARFSKKNFQGPQSRRKLQNLIRTYFDLGGMQMQINVVDQQTLRKAMESPDQYADLIIRIGGYSEFWGRLSEPVRRAVLERTEHE